MVLYAHNDLVCKELAESLWDEGLAGLGLVGWVVEIPILVSRIPLSKKTYTLARQKGCQ